MTNEPTSHDPLPLDSPLDSPRSVALRAFAAHAAKRWEEFASFVDEDSLGEFRLRHVRMADGWDATVAAARDHADAGADALEREFTEFFSVTADVNPALRFVARVASVEELRALSPGEVLARYLEAQAPETRADDSHRQAPVVTREVIGEIPERLDLVHVVYRVRTDDLERPPTEEVEVVSARRRESGWRLMLNRELASAGSMRAANGESPGD